MSYASIDLGKWLAEYFVHTPDLLRILVVGSPTVQEILDLITPISKKIKKVIVWAGEGVNLESSLPSNVQWRKAENRSWDLVLLSVSSIEVISEKALRAELLHSLSVLSNSSNSRLILSVPSSPEFTSPAFRIKV